MRILLSVSVIILLVSGCGKTTPEDFATAYTAHLNDLADALQPVASRDQADAAAIKVESLLSEAQSLQEQARRLTEEGTLPDEVQQNLNAALTRVKDEMTRLRESNLITLNLNNALEQFELANKAALNYAKAGAMPKPETLLEAGYVEYILAMEALADATNSITDLASAQAKLAEFQEIGRRRNAALLKIGQAGGEEPPHGTPKKYDNHMSAASQRAMQADTRLMNLPQSSEIIAVLTPAIEPSEDAKQSFRIDARIRSAGTGNMVTVTLRNNRALQSEQHQKMSQMLKQAANAIEMEALIDGDNYRVVLSPVPDIQAFIDRLDLGTVSNVDPAGRSFVLTIDPEKVPNEAVAGDPRFGPRGNPFGAGRPGFPPGQSVPRNETPAGGMSDFDTQKVETVRGTMVATHGKENVLEIQFKNGGQIGVQRMAKALGVITRTTQARLLQAFHLSSRDGYYLMKTDKKVKQIADSIDLGTVERADENYRLLVIALDDAKVPPE